MKTLKYLNRTGLCQSVFVPVIVHQNSAHLNVTIFDLLP